MRDSIRELVAAKDSPEALARGLAVGIFFGVSFFWGFQVLLALLFSHLVRGNKLVAIAMTAVSNPLTSLPLYTMCYVVGRAVVGGDVPPPDFAAIQGFEGFLALGPGFFGPMFLGTTIVGAVAAAVAYLSSARLLAAARRSVATGAS